MKGAILAAGEGKRLGTLLGNLPKPLLKIGNETLIDRQIELLSNEPLDEIVIIIREDAHELKKHLMETKYKIPIRIIEKNTSAGIFSFFAIKKYLKDSPFFLFTVDIICREKEVLDFMKFCKTNQNVDMIAGITTFSLDEKPVYVKTDENNKIIALGRGIGKSKFITAGLFYCLPTVYKEEDSAIKAEIEHLSDFFGYIVNKGYKVLGYPLGKTIDVDDENDLKEAEKLLKESGEI
jgi:NDP-sugar pyrophosphorylase family protein